MDTPAPGTPPPPHGLPSDPSRCRLLGPTALVVQALMGVLVVASLVIKRQLEKRKRPWRIWLWDIGKQLAGQMVIHLLNLVISDQIALAANNNPCSLYFLNVLIDTTIGVLIFFLALKGFTYLFTTHLGYEGFISGQYGVPPRPQFWWKQLVPYLLSIIVMKLLILLPLLLPVISPALSTFAQTLLEWLSPRIQVIFVMAVFPLTMTVIQFCIVDQVIKAGGKIASGAYDEEQGGSGGSGGGAYARLSTGDSSAFLRPGDTSSQHLAADIPPSKSPVLPSSPLLSASRQSSPGLSRRYGSMTTTRNESMWEAISRERPEENADEAYSTYVNALGTEDRLDPRNKRSRAPSPDTIMLSPGPFPSSSRFGDEGDQGR